MSIGLTRIFDTSEEMVGAVSERLEAYGLLVQSSEFQSVFNIFTKTPFQVRLTIKNTVQYDSIEILEQIKQAVIDVSGDAPVNQSLPFVKMPGQSQKETGDVNPNPDKEKDSSLLNLIPAGIAAAGIAIVFVIGATIYSYRAR